jgi:UDP-N-acetylglucosamine pyrophosphorylase
LKTLCNLKDEQFIELEDMARLNASGDANGEGGMAIVLVAGGMGQRLSYQGGGIVSKVQIPLDLLTKTTFMEQYCGWIKAIELASNAHHGRSEASYLNIPFFIMTSAETHEGIRSFMTTNFCFGLEPTQIMYFFFSLNISEYSFPSGYETVMLSNRLCQLFFPIQRPAQSS